MLINYNNCYLLVTKYTKAMRVLYHMYAIPEGCALSSPHHIETMSNRIVRSFLCDFLGNAIYAVYVYDLDM